MDVSREQLRPPVSVAELASARDFRLGNLLVSPSRREITGPLGSAEAQPRVMQVLVALAEDLGHVVTRETLFERCWGGVYVGDDSLNRAVLALRKASEEVGGKGFEVQTIRKAGYCLTGSVSAVANERRETATGFARRDLTKAAAGILTLGALGGWAIFNSSRERRFDELMRRGHEALAGDDDLFRPDIALRAFEAAARIRPDDSRALGWLALTKSYFAQVASETDSSAAIANATQTAQKALALDPREPNALMAMFELEGATLDWLGRDRLLRQVIEIDPRNELATGELASLLLAAGLVRESAYWNDRNVRLLPLSQNTLAGRAVRLWILGRLGDADNVMDQLRASFPTSRWVWSVRFRLYALTGRARAAQAMLDANPKMVRPGPETDLWRASLRALADPALSNVVHAREACLNGSRVSGELAGYAMVVLSGLNDVDTAFEVANGHLLSRSAVVQAGKRVYGRDPTDAMQRINTSSLFLPPCINMRSDARFMPLCEGVGLAEYWRMRSVTPDYVRLDAASRQPQLTR